MKKLNLKVTGKLKAEAIYKGIVVILKFTHAKNGMIYLTAYAKDRRSKK